MTSETRTVRPYRGVDHFQAVLDETVLRIGERELVGSTRVALTLDEFLNYPITMVLAGDDHDRHHVEGRVAEGLGDLMLTTSDVELVVLASSPRLKMVDVVYAARLDEIDAVPDRIVFPRPRPRAMQGPVGGCDVRAYFCLARQFPPRPLRPWRRGTWLGKQEYQLRTDAGAVGFMPVRLTDALRRDLQLDDDVTKYARVDPDVSVFDPELPPDAVLVFIDEGLLDRLAVGALSPVGKQLQRQLFLDAAWAVVTRAHVELQADPTLTGASIEDFSGSLVHGLVVMLAGRGAEPAIVRARDDRFRQLVDDPARFLSNLEARLSSRRDVMDLFED